MKERRERIGQRAGIVLLTLGSTRLRCGGAGGIVLKLGYAVAGTQPARVAGSSFRPPSPSLVAGGAAGACPPFTIS